MGTPCLAAERGDIAAIVTDDHPAVTIPLWPRSDVTRLVDMVLGLVREI